VINASAGTEAAVALTGGPGNATDWVALYAVGAGNGQYLAWNYEFRLFANNSYQLVATSPTVALAASSAQIAVSITIAVPRAPVLVAIARGIVPPRVVDAVVVTGIVVAVTWIEAVEHTRLLPETDRRAKKGCVTLVQRICAWDRCGGWRVDWDAPSRACLGSLCRTLGRRLQAAPRRSTRRGAGREATSRY